MTSPADTLTVQQLDEVIERAKDEVVRLCTGRWLMSVPADEIRDSDLLLMAALDAAQATVRRQQAALDAVTELADEAQQRQDRSFSVMFDGTKFPATVPLTALRTALASPAPTEATT